MTNWPSVGIVIPTRDRPEQLRRSISAVLAQDYSGDLEVVVVYDGEDLPVGAEHDASVRRLRNGRRAGLAGARNTGILALDTDFVAFCDDDDTWLPGKLQSQVRLLVESGAEFASCAITVDYAGTSTVRRAGTDRVCYDQLLRSRMVMVHSSTFVIRRDCLVGGLGLVDEEIPYGQGEDWDLALRAARRAPIVNIDEPLVRVSWSESSYFSEQWVSKLESLQWLLNRHPDLDSGTGAARIYGQIAFSYAALGRRAEAGRWAMRGLRRNWREPRVPIALAVASGLVSSSTVLHLLHSRGHGV
jgi:glycosyltransferase involved in cell wall biosynthesis